MSERSERTTQHRSLPDGGERSEITAEGLSAMLRSEGHEITVTALGSEAVGTGQMATSLRLTPTYQGDPGPLPDSFVAKVPAEITGPMVAGAYRTEVDFYRHLAPTLDVRVPRCWHAYLSDDASDFLLLLDDLAPATQGDQLSGCDPGAAMRAVETLAGLHGPRWCDPTLATDGPLTPVSAQDAATLPMVMEPMTEVFLDRFAGRVREADAEVLRTVAPVMGEWIAGRPWPFAPVHGDYRLDNLMFAPDEGPVTALDWQTVSLGLPARDVAYLCATSLSIEDRRAHDHEVVAAWQGGLAALGVRDLTFEGCFEDYRYGLLQAPLVTVIGCAVGTPTERGDAMFLAMIERSCAAIRDLDPLSLL